MDHRPDLPGEDVDHPHRAAVPHNHGGGLRRVIVKAYGRDGREEGRGANGVCRSPVSARTLHPGQELEGGLLHTQASVRQA